MCNSESVIKFNNNNNNNNNTPGGIWGGVEGVRNSKIGNNYQTGGPIGTKCGTCLQINLGMDIWRLKTIFLAP